VDDERYQKTLGLFTYQAGHALVWRDAIDSWFQRMSGINDAQGRVGHDPNRIEAEEMKAVGYVSADVNPWETASGGKAMICRGPAPCTLSAPVNKPAGEYDVAVQYFDTWGGVSKYELAVNGKSVASWSADDLLPPAQMDPNLDGQTSTRFTAHGVSLKPGDLLELRGTPAEAPPAAANVRPAGDGAPARPRPDTRELAPVDYIEIGPNGSITPQ
jgi:alpha-glucuronidase